MLPAAATGAACFWNQDMADWVCAGLSMLRLVCVGVFASLGAATWLSVAMRR